MLPLAVIAAWLALAGSADAQALPSEPVTVASGRLVGGGDVAVTAAPSDPGFFNYTDYDHNTLRELRLELTAAVSANSRLAFLGELRGENFNHVSPFTLSARIRPIPTRRLDIQIGRIPPIFGAFARRAYGKDNLPIGYPLAYQYLTSLRADADENQFVQRAHGLDSHMSAFVLVFSHRSFATTDPDGSYRIDNIPPGTYTVAAWHEGDVRDTRKIVVPEQGGVVEQDFEVQ